MTRPWFLIAWPLIVALVAAAVVFGIATARTNARFNKVDTKDQLWAIQPGLGTVMVEYDTRFGNVWWAADGGNWDMVSYQLKEMTEIQEVAETTRPGRADALKGFEQASLDPLIAAAKAKDKAAFTDAYDKAITGCNKCHGEQKDDAGNTFRFVRIMRPTSPAPFSNVDWKGQP